MQTVHGTDRMLNSHLFYTAQMPQTNDKVLSILATDASNASHGLYYSPSFSDKGQQTLSTSVLQREHELVPYLFTNRIQILGIYHAFVILQIMPT